MNVLAALRGPWRALRERLSNRPDSEHEQAIVRLIVPPLIVLYLLPDAIARQAEPTLWVMLGYLGVAILIFGDIVVSPSVSPVRRVFAAVADVSTLTWCMATLGESAAPLFLVYVWVTLANGFRFGTTYLVIALGLSVVGFSTVLAYNEFWRGHVQIGIGMLVGFVALSLYVRSLVRKLFDAVARAEAANQAKRRFISVVSHELRTPLNAILGMADLLRDTPLNREQADMLQTVRSASRVMLGLVEEVLDFSKIEAGKLALEEGDFDLHALVHSTCRILSAQAAAKGVEFVVSIMPEVPPSVRGDAHYLRQVLINLAGNAVKFTERGSVTVHVTAQEETERAVRLKFSVRDTGIGIPPEAQARIFESFTQGDQSTTRRFGGTGLGTTIAKQLIELMGGRVGLESAVGLGSTFWFEVPLAKQPERQAAGAGELAGARILLVGFPPEECETLESTLRGWGAIPVTAQRVEDAVARVVREISVAPPYHSVMFYGSDADIALAEQFRRAAPAPAPPTVLAVAREFKSARFAALASGFTSVLELPFDKRQLFNVLHSVGATDEVREGVIRLQDYARPGAVARHLNVLVADDNPTNRAVLGKILERAGHSATLVADGEQALDAIEREHFDALLLDRNMPVMGGIEVLKALAAMGAGSTRLPALVLSADVTPEGRQECLDAGAAGFLGKPVEATRLLDELYRVAEIASPAAQRGASPAQAERERNPRSAVVPAVNLETLAHLEELGSSAAFVEKLVQVFLSDNATLVAKMENAVAARNFGEFRNLLHALKGSSASMGIDRLTRLCSDLGRLSDSEMRLQASALVKSIAQELAAARHELERYVAERRRSAV